MMAVRAGATSCKNLSEDYAENRVLYPAVGNCAIPREASNNEGDTSQITGYRARSPSYPEDGPSTQNGSIPKEDLTKMHRVSTATLQNVDITVRDNPEEQLPQKNHE